MLSENSNYTYNLIISNNGATDASVHWKLNKKADFPSEWRTTVCDLNLCYDENVDLSFQNRPNTIKANTSSIFTIKLDPNKKKASTNLSFGLYSDANHTNLLASTSSTSIVTADVLLSNSERGSADDFMIYPNPCQDYFAIRNDDGVSKISIFSIIGKEVRKENHSRNQTHDISDLPKGIYLVRLMNSGNKILKTIRVSKR